MHQYAVAEGQVGTLAEVRSNTDLQLPRTAGLKALDTRGCHLVPRYQNAADKGLARLMSFLRDEIELERLAEAERIRPRAIAAGPFSVYKCTEASSFHVCWLSGHGCIAGSSCSGIAALHLVTAAHSLHLAHPHRLPRMHGQQRRRATRTEQLATPGSAVGTGWHREALSSTCSAAQVMQHRMSRVCG